MKMIFYFHVRRSVKTPQDKKYEDHVLENDVSLAHSQSITKLSKKKSYVKGKQKWNLIVMMFAILCPPEHENTSK